MSCGEQKQPSAGEVRPSLSSTPVMGRHVTLHQLQPSKPHHLQVRRTRPLHGERTAEENKASRNEREKKRGMTRREEKRREEKRRAEALGEVDANQSN
ncbi:Hypothetical predicted protein [Xyrichtys novacula]|uniref:Small EDRK-rich factor-like N-terminal domain-containing protein n=1 Tax=Xyrichtys novacula TaxID=13765 RepID=A0AAV1F6Q3_XYRNO|nr:Hypothetical predicted protein [Xyrichtys novacula]